MYFLVSVCGKNITVFLHKFSFLIQHSHNLHNFLVKVTENGTSDLTIMKIFAKLLKLNKNITVFF